MVVKVANQYRLRLHEHFQTHLGSVRQMMLRHGSVYSMVQMQVMTYGLC